MFNHDESWNYIEDVLKSNLSFHEGWLKIVAFHEVKQTDLSLVVLRRIDLDAELLEITKWIKVNLANEPLPNTVVALWFGIFTAADEDGNDAGYTIYFSGTDSYDEEEIENWISNETYSPHNKYFIPAAFNTLLEKLKQTHSEAYPFLDWILPISYAALLIQTAIQNGEVKPLLLQNKSMLFVTLGYDDGDYINLPALTA